jgi:hypothetical protein
LAASAAYDLTGLPAKALLNLNRRAGLGELLPDALGLVLRDAFLDRLRRAVNEVLGLLQAEARDLADDLDDVDLVRACRGEDDVEFGLLLLSRGRRGRRAAADTPNVSSIALTSCDASSSVKPLIWSIIPLMSAIAVSSLSAVYALTQAP